MFRPGHDVAHADAILEPRVRVADHHGVETDTGHDGEAFAVDHAGVELLGPVQADPDAPVEMSLGSRGSWPAGWPCRPAGCDGALCRPARRGSVAPSRRRPRRTAGLRPPRRHLDLLRCFLLFGTSYQRGSVTPSSASTRRSSTRPPPSDFPVCASTATDVMRGPRFPARRTARRSLHRCGDGSLPRRRGSPGSRRGSAPVPSTTPAKTSMGWCRPRYTREIPTLITSATASAHTAILRAR